MRGIQRHPYPADFRLRAKFKERLVQLFFHWISLTCFAHVYETRENEDGMRTM